MAKPTEVPGLSKQTPLAVAGPLLLRARLSDVTRYQAALGRDGQPDPDAVHDMRVAARRLRAAIVLFDGRELRALEPEVKALQDALGAVRDFQVERAWLRRAARSRRHAAAATVLLRWADRGGSRAEKKLHRALEAWESAVATEVDRAVGASPLRGRLGGTAVRKVLRNRLATLGGRLERALPRPTPRRAHRLRITAKKVRYLAELVHPVLRRATGRVLSKLVPLQGRLGDLHDTDVRLGRLEELASSGRGAERDAASALLDTVRQERAKQERVLREELERWHAERVVRDLRARFRR